MTCYYTNKVFPTSFHGSALLWFHQLLQNSINSFRDIFEAFVEHYLCSTRQKQNVSALQNIKMMENKSLQAFMKRFGQAVLEVESYNMDVILQIFKKNINLGTLFSKSIAKKILVTMDDLF